MLRTYVEPVYVASVLGRPNSIPLPDAKLLRDVILIAARNTILHDAEQYTTLNYGSEVVALKSEIESFLALNSEYQRLSEAEIRAAENSLYHLLEGDGNLSGLSEMEQITLATLGINRVNSTSIIKLETPKYLFGKDASYVKECIVEAANETARTVKRSSNSENTGSVDATIGHSVVKLLNRYRDFSGVEDIVRGKISGKQAKTEKLANEARSQITNFRNQFDYVGMVKAVRGQLFRLSDETGARPIVQKALDRLEKELSEQEKVMVSGELAKKKRELELAKADFKNGKGVNSKNEYIPIVEQLNRIEFQELVELIKNSTYKSWDRINVGNTGSDNPSETRQGPPIRVRDTAALIWVAIHDRNMVLGADGKLIPDNDTVVEIRDKDNPGLVLKQYTNREFITKNIEDKERNFLTGLWEVFVEHGSNTAACAHGTHNKLVEVLNQTHPDVFVSEDPTLLMRAKITEVMEKEILRPTYEQLGSEEKKEKLKKAWDSDAPTSEEWILVKEFISEVEKKLLGSSGIEGRLHELIRNEFKDVLPANSSVDNVVQGLRSFVKKQMVNIDLVEKAPVPVKPFDFNYKNSLRMNYNAPLASKSPQTRTRAMMYQNGLAAAIHEQLVPLNLMTDEVVIKLAKELAFEWFVKDKEITPADVFDSIYEDHQDKNYKTIKDKFLELAENELVMEQIENKIEKLILAEEKRDYGANIEIEMLAQMIAGKGGDFSISENQARVLETRPNFRAKIMANSTLKTLFSQKVLENFGRLGLKENAASALAALNHSMAEVEVQAAIFEQLRSRNAITEIEAKGLEKAPKNLQDRVMSDPTLFTLLVRQILVVGEHKFPTLSASEKIQNEKDSIKQKILDDINGRNPPGITAEEAPLIDCLSDLREKVIETGGALLESFVTQLMTNNRLIHSFGEASVKEEMVKQMLARAAGNEITVAEANFMNKHDGAKLLEIIIENNFLVKILAKRVVENPELTKLLENDNVQTTILSEMNDVVKRGKPSVTTAEAVLVNSDSDLRAKVIDNPQLLESLIQRVIENPDLTDILEDNDFQEKIMSPIEARNSLTVDEVKLISSNIALLNTVKGKEDLWDSFVKQVVKNSDLIELLADNDVQEKIIAGMTSRKTITLEEAKLLDNNNAAALCERVIELGDPLLASLIKYVLAVNPPLENLLGKESILNVILDGMKKRKTILPEEITLMNSAAGSSLLNSIIENKADRTLLWLAAKTSLMETSLGVYQEIFNLIKSPPNLPPEAVELLKNPDADDFIKGVISEPLLFPLLIKQMILDPNPNVLENRKFAINLKVKMEEALVIPDEEINLLSKSSKLLGKILDMLATGLYSDVIPGYEKHFEEKRIKGNKMLEQLVTDAVTNESKKWLLEALLANEKLASAVREKQARAAAEKLPHHEIITVSNSKETPSGGNNTTTADKKSFF